MTASIITPPPPTTTITTTERNQRNVLTNITMKRKNGIQL
jgi:hypothetical protein